MVLRSGCIVAALVLLPTLSAAQDPCVTTALPAPADTAHGQSDHTDRATLNLRWGPVPAFDAGRVRAGSPLLPARWQPASGSLGAMAMDTQRDPLATALLIHVERPFAAMTPYLLAGPQYNLLGSQPPEAVHSSGCAATCSLSGDPPDAYQAPTWGGTLGLGVATSRLLPLPTFAEIRYDFDVTAPPSSFSRTAPPYAFRLLLGVKL